MNFTKRGAFEGLVAHATKFADKTEAIKQKELKYWLPQIFREFDYKFNALFKNVPLKNGEAFLEFVHLYGFPYKLSDCELTERIKAYGLQFNMAAGACYPREAKAYQLSPCTELC